MSKTSSSPAESLLATARQLRWDTGENIHESLMEAIYQDASQITAKVVSRTEEAPRFNWDRALDHLLTSRWLGFPMMLLILAGVFWITIRGANIPSAALSALLVDTFHPALKSLAAAGGLPWWLSGILIDGMYLATAWVVSVMLPPMAIFFPLFTLLEDFGYLPRVAFNLDNLFHKVGAHGKQALSMSMGYGCNAAGVIATRIIDSPRERLIAIITNNFSLCNGRWPAQILVASLFIGVLAPGQWGGLLSAAAVVTITLLGILLTFLTSGMLSHSLLKGEASAFSLELPPYRPPQIWRTLYTSLIDRTFFVLWRAVVFALPAGALIWLSANLSIGGLSVAEHLVGGLNPFGLLLGLNGVILLAFIIAIPANEIVIPTILMLTVISTGLSGFGEGAGVIFELSESSAYRDIFTAGGWTLLTAINFMLFSLVHNPCSTTLFTIYKETNSVRWTVLSALLPLVMGFIICFWTAQLWRLFSG